MGSRPHYLRRRDGQRHCHAFLAQELPFGGLGASGMGAYHGEAGFERFSHARAVFHQTRLDVAGLVGLRPPYGARRSGY